MKKLLLAVGCVGIVLAAMWWLVPQDAHDRGVSSGDVSSAVAPSASVAAFANDTSATGVRSTLATDSDEWQNAASQLAVWAARAASLGPLPHSLSDTQPDGQLDVDADGNLVITHGVKRFFEYYLSTVGEESLDDIKSRIARELVQRLPETAAVQAWALFERYTQYKEALSAIPAPDQNTSTLMDTMKARSDARKSWLGTEISDAFFGEEEAYDHYALQKRQLEADDSLSETEKQQRLEQLTSQLPDQVREVLEETTRPGKVAQQVETMRAQGSSEADIQAYRATQFGSEAAERLGELDKQRAVWQTRYDDYRQQREAILTAGLDASDQQQQIEALQKRLFDTQEQRRVNALDRISEQQ